MTEEKTLQTLKLNELNLEKTYDENGILIIKVPNQSFEDYNVNIHFFFYNQPIGELKDCLFKVSFEFTGDVTLDEAKETIINKYGENDPDTTMLYWSKGSLSSFSDKKINKMKDIVLSQFESVTKEQKESLDMVWLNSNQWALTSAILSINTDTKNVFFTVDGNFAVISKLADKYK